MFINHKYIEKLLEEANASTILQQEAVIAKAENAETLSHKDIATLLQIEDENLLQRMFKVAGDLKKKIYGNRIVMFAPLYISNYCVNSCTYCGFSRKNKFERRKLNREEIQEEVRILQKMGHKRLALEAGEDPLNCPIEYVLDALDAIYETKLDNGSIRRVNVNIAATTVENYTKLKVKGIGTYILFQETYHKPTFEKVHPKCVKGDYDYHLTAFDRAMTAGCDDVGAGVLFGLYEPKFEVLALMLHNEHLEKEFGAGFHTISMPRLKKAEGMELSDFPHIIDDSTFKKLVAIIRIAVPLTGIIMSTRETAEMRRELLHYGVSQVSAGSCTGIGGYKDSENNVSNEQFEVSDERKPLEVIHGLLDDGYIPSYCTACYRQGRTGDRFMQLAKSGNIENVCTPNSLMTLMEYMLDYGDEELLEKGKAIIDREAQKIARPDIKEMLIANLQQLEEGKRDLFV
jgi:2-iminoacetate synthase